MNYNTIIRKVLTIRGVMLDGQNPITLYKYILNSCRAVSNTVHIGHRLSLLIH